MNMSALEISLIVLACVFGSAILVLYLQTLVPDHHLSADSRDSVKLSTGIIATMAALVLGLLVSSAKNSFDQINNELVGSAVNVVVLDRTLADYGPEAQEIRNLLKGYFMARVGLLTSGKNAKLAKLDSSKMVNEIEELRAKVLQLSPGNDAQRQLQAQATQTMSELIQARWQVVLQRSSSLSMPLVTLLVVWLAVIFAAFGMFSPRNQTVVATLFLSALSVSGAIFLILELNSPLTGFITISNEAMHAAIAHLGQ
jgi:hypothetical protein